MKPSIILLSFLLSACTSEAAELEATLNSYARYLEHPASESAATKNLSGAALEAARTSGSVLRDLGLRQIGSAKFEVQEISAGKAIACLDVSRTHFEDLSGRLLDLSHRAQRLKMEIKFSVLAKRHIISDMNLLEGNC